MNRRLFFKIGLITLFTLSAFIITTSPSLLVNNLRPKTLPADFGSFNDLLFLDTHPAYGACGDAAEAGNCGCQPGGYCGGCCESCGGCQANNSPHGFFDNAGCDYLEGWVCDDDDKDALVNVIFQEEGVEVARTGTNYAAINRLQGVADSCGGNPNHGFKIQTPSTLKNGANHTISAIGINIGSTGENRTLFSSPKTLNCPPPPPNPTPTPTPIPNCSNVTLGAEWIFGSSVDVYPPVPAELTKGQTYTFAADFSSPTGSLAGSINASKTPSYNGSWDWAEWVPGTNPKSLVASAGKLSFTWTPQTIGDYDLFCRAFNGIITSTTNAATKECRGNSAYVNPSNSNISTCAGPNASVRVKVVDQPTNPAITGLYIQSNSLTTSRTSGRLTTQSGKGYYNPVTVSVAGAAGKDRYGANSSIKAYYVILYDKREGTTAEQPAYTDSPFWGHETTTDADGDGDVNGTDTSNPDFLASFGLNSNIENLLYDIYDYSGSKYKNGVVLAYSTATKKHYVWDPADRIWHNIDPTGIIGYPICGKVSGSVVCNNSTRYYNVTGVADQPKWQVKFDQNFGSKNLYTMVYISDNNGTTAFSGEYPITITP